MRDGADLLYEAHQSKGDRLPSISVVAMTTVLGVLTVASVGLLVSLHRVRRGRIERLTPQPTASRLEGRDHPSPSGLGQTRTPTVVVHSDALEPNDVFVLTGLGGEQCLGRALNGFATQPFADALVDSFRHIRHTALLIGRWVS